LPEGAQARRSIQSIVGELKEVVRVAGVSGCLGEWSRGSGFGSV